jgi:hypothetical protein
MVTWGAETCRRHYYVYNIFSSACVHLLVLITTYKHRLSPWTSLTTKWEVTTMSQLHLMVSCCIIYWDLFLSSLCINHKVIFYIKFLFGWSLLMMGCVLYAVKIRCYIYIYVFSINVIPQRAKYNSGVIAGIKRIAVFAVSNKTVFLRSLWRNSLCWLYSLTYVTYRSHIHNWNVFGIKYMPFFSYGSTALRGLRPRHLRRFTITI